MTDIITKLNESYTVGVLDFGFITSDNNENDTQGWWLDSLTSLYKQKYT